jgi:NAD-dependent DNA ligase
MLVATPILGTMYLDVETTAAPDKSYAEISTIVWWCDRKWYSWVNGKNDPAEFLMFWQHAPQIVTFNGKAFDEPKIIGQFGVTRHRNHLDLMHEAKSHGLTGGLKEIGEICGFPRPLELHNVDGATAIKLWKRFLYDGIEEALQNLLYYNAWDVVLTYCLHSHLTAAQTEAIQESIPFTPDPACLSSVLPKPRQSPTPRKLVGNVRDYWEERKKCPLTVLRGAEVCITGDLDSMEREDAEDLITNLGGIPKKSATRTLDFLVVGNTGEFGRTSKVDAAEQNIASGAHTRIIDEAEFLELIQRTKEGQSI